MRKSVLMIMLITCACIKMQAQVNFVLNSSLETYSRCPTFYDQIKYANYWNGIDSTWDPADSASAYLYCLPEYCNTCSGNLRCASPLNERFYQYPRTGNGMAQLTMFFDESYTTRLNRDYMQGRLNTNLMAGKSYCITFYVNFAGAFSSIASGYAVDHIGVYLDNGAIDMDTGAMCGMAKPFIIPQVYTTTIITDTLNWTKIQGSFVAMGNERFITIGNFFDKAHTNFIHYPGRTAFSWYLVDDVSVIESTERANAGPDVAIVPGDSVHIGSYDEGMPCDWYRLGSSTVLTHNGGLWVKPDSSTSYVVELDLCGVVTRDTVRVVVDRTGIPLTPKGGPSIWPNPASQQLTIEHAAGMGVDIYDVVGKGVFNTLIKSDKEVIDISSLPKGVYVVCVSPTPTLPQGEGDVTQRRFMRLVKE